MIGYAALGVPIDYLLAASLMAFLAISAMAKGIIGGVGGWFGYGHATLEGIFGYLLAPLA